MIDFLIGDDPGMMSGLTGVLANVVGYARSHFVDSPCVAPAWTAGAFFARGLPIAVSFSAPEKLFF
ncbi:hypothetical protein [Cellvibrio japonicus]|uniref:hypothetical protein n=1 Tax=Cellvibrio japonicus TaxID=155077 RepID=UPI0005A215C4|nr:hypothetical protein [Cellvibrio japonicus]QEI10956.1 hypothetical protein FY117_01070 [Cellvibrio japonicus]QEI14532.1 hypothetical protein FY116_01070 [Cellvibrio japonicus]QEI18110.1 hypothetical protein FY115_01070 [Cellvibrio japonicus]